MSQVYVHYVYTQNGPDHCRRFVEVTLGTLVDHYSFYE